MLSVIYVICYLRIKFVIFNSHFSKGSLKAVRSLKYRALRGVILTMFQAQYVENDVRNI